MVSRVMVAVWVAMFPAVSVAVTVTMLAPCTSPLILALQLAPAIVTGPAVADVSTLTWTVAPVSTVPLMILLVWLVGVVALMVRDGGAVSRSIVSEKTADSLPSESMTLT